MLLACCYFTNDMSMAVNGNIWLLYCAAYCYCCQCTNDVSMDVSGSMLCCLLLFCQCTNDETITVSGSMWLL